jgi:hypothetical protein
VDPDPVGPQTCGSGTMIITDGNVFFERIDVRWRALCSQTGRADGRGGGGVPAVRALHEEHAPRAGA